MVNGLAVLGDASAGLIMPIVAEVTPASSKAEGKLIATGKLGKIAKEAVENVSAIIKKHIGKDVSILKDRRGGTTKPMTLAEFEKRIETGDYDQHEWGGCGCGV